MWQVIKLCKWVSSLFLYMFKITHGKQAKYHFKYLGLIEAFLILQKGGHTRKIMRGTSYVLILSLYLSGYYMCCSSRAHWLLVLRQYLYHTRPSLDRQPSQSYFEAQWCLFLYSICCKSSSRKNLWLQCIGMMGGFQVAQMRKIQMNWAQLSIFYQIFKMADREDGPQNSQVLKEN